MTGFTASFREIPPPTTRKNAAKTCKNICEVYGDDAGDESTVRRWIAKFKAREFSLEDDNHSGRPSKLDIFKVKIQENLNIKTRELEELEVSKSTVHEVFSFCILKK
ncbi:Hypothetical predicted protein [Octopus vulgaris]|uniref:Mos1 transposase HTH domain-containing protein n=1 Tax=Octopus vulgaris TaxID=6645 RepID=A0AA36B6J0_OCTVU|nr:Hypothetical predicted protein [Octopus vulgaris]